MLDRIEPGSPALHVAARWRLEGKVSDTDLSEAFSKIVERHPFLRTSIVDEDGEPAQHLQPPVPLRVPVVDLTGLDEAGSLAEAERVAQREARISFDLSAPPLIRIVHLRLRDDLSILLMTAHRIVCDVESLGILADEMRRICSSLQAGRTAGAPIPTVAEKVHRPVPPAQGGSQSDDDFWKHTLLGLRPFELTPDHARPHRQTTKGGVASTLLPRDAIPGTLDAARMRDGSAQVVPLAALFTLLHRYTGESDIAIGCHVSGREDPGMAHAIGPFGDMIVLRADVSGNPSLAELTSRVAERVAEAFAHQVTTFGRVVELLAPERDLGRSALVSVIFACRRSFLGKPSNGAFRLVDLPACSAGATHDVAFLVEERRDGWRVSCEVNADLFDPETAEQLLRHFVNLLRAGAAHPALSLSSLAMLDEAEVKTLVVDSNQNPEGWPESLTIPALFAARARESPDAAAVVCGEQQLTYRELDQASNRLAHYLRSHGIGRGKLVGICIERTPDLVVALLAVLKSGGAYVPLDPAYPRLRLAQIIEDARPAAMLTTSALRDRFDAGRMVTILLDGDAAGIRRREDSSPDTLSGPDDIAYVIYTSGSTGRPKGVAIRNCGFANLLWSMRIRPGFTVADTLVAVTTVSFDIAALELFLPLIVGARLVLARDIENSDGGLLLGLLRRHGATVLQATPITWQILLEAGWKGDPPLKMWCGGEAMTRSLADRLLLQGGELWNLYGPTETTIWSSVSRVEPGLGPVRIGSPIANTQLHVMDAHAQLLPMGVAGELFIGGAGVAAGYPNLPEMTRDRFVPDPFGEPGARLYRTGDRVRRRGRGELEFLGRNDHQVKVRGFRIELGEIESVIRAHPDVADCVAVAGLAPSGEAAIRAYFVARRQERVDASADLVGALRSCLREALPVYMIPSLIVELEALPRTPNGKIDRAALPAAWPEETRATVPPSGERERRLARIWSEILGTPATDASANFFETGGHSMLAVRLTARIEVEFGRKLSLATIFQNPTIAGQALLLQQDDTRDFDFRQVVKLQAGGLRPPLIAINNTGIYYLLSKRLGLDQPFTSLQLFDPSLPTSSLPRTLEEIAAGYAELIRRVQGTGPYALLGWCVAGTLAFEVARQLTGAGETVSRLILFDALAPGHLKRLPWIKAVLADYSYRWKLIGIDWDRTWRGPGGLATFLGNRAIVRKLKHAGGRAATNGTDAGSARAAPLDPGQYDQWLLRYLEDAAASYEPGPYAGAVTLFRSSQEPSGRFLDPRNGWGAFAAGGVEVIVIDGDHFSIFQEPSVSQIAGHLESAPSSPP